MHHGYMVGLSSSSTSQFHREQLFHDHCLQQLLHIAWSIGVDHCILDFRFFLLHLTPPKIKLNSQQGFYHSVKFILLLMFYDCPGLNITHPRYEKSLLLFPCPGPLPALSFRPRIIRPRCALILRWVRMMRTVRRSCMTAGTGYGLSPFVKVRPIMGLCIINRDGPAIFPSRTKKFFKTTMTQNIVY